MQMLRDNNILSVPVVDAETGQFSGVFSVTDLMKALVKRALFVILNQTVLGTDRPCPWPCHRIAAK